MGLGKKKPELKSELFRSTESVAQVEKIHQEKPQRITASEVNVEKNPKERFSLYLEQETAKGLRVYAAKHDIKNVSGFIAGLIGKFLEENT